MLYKVREVTCRKDLMKFIRFPESLYKGCSQYVPPLHKGQEHELMHAASLKYCTRKMWLAEDEKGKVVGRICAMVNPRYNEKYGTKRARFGWFDFIDDYDVFKALIDAVAEWGRSKGMLCLNGPVGFTDFDHQGLLLEGFDYNAPMASLYTHPYYIAHYERYGLTKEADWIEYQITPPAEAPEKMRRLVGLVAQRYNLHTVKVKSVRELKQRYGYTYFDVLDSAYQKLYNYQPMTPRQKQYYCKMYFPILNFDFVTMVANEQDEIVAVGLGMPSISEALRKCGGHLFPFGWYHVLKALKSKTYEAFDLLIIAVRPDYQDRGLNAVIIADQHPYFIKYGIKEVETTAILETNTKN